MHVLGRSCNCTVVSVISPQSAEATAAEGTCSGDTGHQQVVSNNPVWDTFFPTQAFSHAKMIVNHFLF